VTAPLLTPRRASLSIVRMPTAPIPSSTLTQWRSHMIAAGLSRRTILERIRTITRIETDLGCPALNADQFQLADWISRGDVAPATRAAWHSMLSAFYRWASDVGLRADNPMAKIRAAKRPKRAPRPISDIAFRRLLTESPNDDLTAMLLLGGYQGLRVSEMGRGARLGRLAARMFAIGLSARRPTSDAHR